jgi:hypothetical protein
LVACQKQQTRRNVRIRPADFRNVKVRETIQKEPQFIDHALLGSELNSDGVVSKQTTSFTDGQPVYLTLILRQSPHGLQTRAEWQGPDKKTILVDRKDMTGAKVATFTLKEAKVKPGRHHVIGYWGGNIAAEKDFDILARAKGKKKKG